MRSELPLLTVGIPTYNSAHFLPDALASIMRQGLDDFEVVIVDNASEDDTEQVVRSFANDRIRYFRNTTNLGSRENHNRCLQKARGRYFKFVCADDVLLDGLLSRQIAVLESQLDVSLVSCDIIITDSELANRKLFRFFPGTCSGSRVINACLSGLSCYIGGPSNFMFRLSDSAGITLDTSYRYVSDLRFGLRLLERGNYVNIGEAGYLYRRHAASDTVANCPEDIQMPEYFRLVDEFGWWNPLTCTQAVRRGGAQGKRAARLNFQSSLRPDSLLKAISALPDVWRMRSLR